MKEVIHVGLQKTGSTFLQRNVFPLLNNESVFFRHRVNLTDKSI